MKIKDLIGIILILGSVIGLIICVIASAVFYIQNPDMTALRRFIEYPAPSIWAVVCFIVGRVGLKLIK